MSSKNKRKNKQQNQGRLRTIPIECIDDSVDHNDSELSAITSVINDNNGPNYYYENNLNDLFLYPINYLLYMLLNMFPYMQRVREQFGYRALYFISYLRAPLNGVNSRQVKRETKKENSEIKSIKKKKAKKTVYKLNIDRSDIGGTITNDDEDYDGYNESNVMPESNHKSELLEMEDLKLNELQIPLNINTNNSSSSNNNNNKKRGSKSRKKLVIEREPLSPASSQARSTDESIHYQGRS